MCESSKEPQIESPSNTAPQIVSHSLSHDETLKRESDGCQTKPTTDVMHHSSPSFEAASLIKGLDGTKNDFCESNQQIEALREEIKELTIAKQTDEAVVARLSEALNNEIARVYEQQQSDFRILQAEIESYRSHVEYISADNEQLRSYIFRMENDWNPVHDEEYYIQRFREIKTDIEMWVASYAGKGLGKLSDTSEARLLQILTRFGVEFLNANLETRILYKEPRLRIPFIRHIIAAFLFHQVFRPFAFGLPPEISHALEYIQADIISHGSLFKKTIN